ncbi:hypothetical protein TWF730_004819 [Orbilia blumenaviensis]|uniref:Exonuclease domain-containing protein n=1 Tax=Orbilia blumenaviensis TaxID=1796055 RepID=A0AAV9TYM8_9PEZI
MARKSKRKTSRGKRRPEARDDADEKAHSPLPTLPSFDDLPTFTLQSHTPSEQKSARKRTADHISDAEDSSKEDSSSKRHCASTEDTPKDKPNDDKDGDNYKKDSNDGGDDDDGEGWQHIPVRKKKTNRGDSYPEISISSQRIHTWTRIADLQSLILHLLSFDAPPQWMLIKNKSAVRRVVYLYVPGFSMDLFDGRTPLISKPVDEKEEEEEEEKKTKPTHSTLGEFFPVSLSQKPLPQPLAPLSSIFTHVLPVRAGGDNNKIFSPVYNMLNVPIEADTNKKSNSRHHKRPPRLKISDLLLSTEDLIENEYPLHSSQVPESDQPTSDDSADKPNENSDEEEWFETQLSPLPPRNNEAGSTLEGYTIYSLDCEMVKTSSGPTLARISLISWDGTVAYDSLVKPTSPILDYLTPFSGITESMLQDITTTLPDIQQKLKELVDGNTILIGQSLNSDLNALKMRHPWIIDTSVIYDHPRGKPMKPSLKWLSQKFLKKEIQKQSTTGHDSIEDSIACLELVKLKLERGKEFGSTAANFESIFTKLSSSKPPKTGGVVDTTDVNKKFSQLAQYTKRATDDDDVINNVLKAVNGDITTGIAPVDFTWSQLRDLNTSRGWNNSYQKFITDLNTTLITPTSPPITIPEKPIPVSGPELGEVVSKTVERIKRLYDGLPKCSVLVVYGGTGDPVEMGRLNALQALYRKEFKVKKWDECSVKWTDTEEQALRRAIGEARKGVALLAVK